MCAAPAGLRLHLRLQGLLCGDRVHSGSTATQLKKASQERLHHACPSCASCHIERAMLLVHINDARPAGQAPMSCTNVYHRLAHGSLTPDSSSQQGLNMCMLAAALPVGCLAALHSKSNWYGIRRLLLRRCLGCLCLPMKGVTVLDVYEVRH